MPHCSYLSQLKHTMEPSTAAHDHGGQRYNSISAFRICIFPDRKPDTDGTFAGRNHQDPWERFVMWTQVLDCFRNSSVTFFIRTVLLCRPASCTNTLVHSHTDRRWKDVGQSSVIRVVARLFCDISCAAAIFCRPTLSWTQEICQIPLSTMAN